MLNPETLYCIAGMDDAMPHTYGRTPDGVGMYWYDADQRQEAMEDVCEPTEVRYFDSMRSFDKHREMVCS